MFLLVLHANAGVPDRPNVTLINQYGGYELSYPRLAYIDGSEDRKPRSSWLCLSRVELTRPSVLVNAQLGSTPLLIHRTPNIQNANLHTNILSTSYPVAYTIGTKTACSNPTMSRKLFGVCTLQKSNLCSSG